MYKMKGVNSTGRLHHGSMSTGVGETQTLEDV